LRDVKKCYSSIAVFKSFIYPYDSMCLFYCGVSLPEAELMIGYLSIIFNHLGGAFLRGPLAPVGK
jgi:hypothetical protein